MILETTILATEELDLNLSEVKERLMSIDLSVQSHDIGIDICQDINNIGCISMALGKVMLVNNAQICFGSHFEFPNIGKADVLYIATDEKKQYLWSVTEMRYVPTGSDWHDIQIIQGGTSADESINI